MSISQLPPDTPPAGDPATALRTLRATVEQAVAADPTRVGVAELGDLIVELQGCLDALGGVASEWTMAFEQSGGHEDAGSATLAAWMRQQLRLTGHEARRRVRAGQALRVLPRTREALTTGLIGAAHVDAIAHGVRQLGPQVMAAAEAIVLEVAKVCDADAVKQTVTKLRDTLDPDAADAAYLHALERRDVTVTHVGDGYALAGFLDPETGAAFAQVLYAAAKPTDKDDTRTAGQRRCDGLRDLCRAVLDHGLPSDRGLRPHLLVTVNADRLDAVTGSATSRRARRVGVDIAEPAMLHGFGPIPDMLLGRLACDADTTTISMDGSGPGAGALDVGRTARLATMKQRQAVITAQGGVCINPGCDRTHLEIHHMVPWSLGGPTDLANLRGYCTRCHHLIHLGSLVVKPDQNGGWSHHTKSGQHLIDHRRRQHHHTHRWTTALLAGGLDHANNTVMQWRRGQPATTPRSGGDPPPDAI